VDLAQTRLPRSSASLSTGPDAGNGGRARLTVLAGPTAVGKGTVSAYLREHYPQVWISVSMTTRAPRPGEIDGVHYRFVDDEEFDAMIRDGGFLEWAVVHSGARYGTPAAPVDEALAQGRRALLEIDLQGARQVRQKIPDALLVFLSPPSWEELVRRLDGRGTESDDERRRRLDTARLELAAESEFDATVVNADVHQAAKELVNLMESSRI
jgi:guanylate kinase